jgi:DNA-binding GntR family transcriptional regulator
VRGLAGSRAPKRRHVVIGNSKKRPLQRMEASQDMLKKRRNTAKRSAGTTKMPANPGESLSDFAYRALEQMILSGEISPGVWITEKQLGGELGISRTPVREAIRRLMHARLIEVVPRKGMKITEIDYCDQMQLLEFRRHAERFVTMQAARAVDDVAAQYLKTLAGQMERAAVAGDAAGYFQADLEFKFFLLRIVKNPYAENAIHPLWAGARRFSWITRGTRQLTERATLTARLARAIALGDVDATLKATDAYIDHSILAMKQKMFPNDVKAKRAG